MSLTKRDRTTRSIPGITFPTERLADAISAALHREYGGTHSSVKTVVGLLGANERAVKNWFAAKNAPSGESVVALCRLSDEVLVTVLRMAGRTEHLRAKRIVDATDRLREVLDALEEK